MLINQVNKLLCQKYAYTQFIRLSSDRRPLKGFANEVPSKTLIPLKNRGCLKISGAETSSFLQGLITNDMRHFEDGAKSMYAMFLNNKGRVLYDTLIYKLSSDDSFLIECDSDLVGNLLKHLKIFKLRRAINIEDVRGSLGVWALISVENDIPDVTLGSEGQFTMFKDPRLSDLGYRIVSSLETPLEPVNDVVGKDVEVHSIDDAYKFLRYQLGVIEGKDELPPGTRFPLEINCDYLHGVSFHKGCYIGQELLARHYFTGVIRKRVMPLKFPAVCTSQLPRDAIIASPKGNIGKLIGVLHNHGIGMLRIKEALESPQLSICDESAQAFKPSWWPVEAPREVSKTESNQ